MMKKLAVALVFFCTLVFIVIGVFLVAFSFNVFTLQDLSEVLRQVFRVEDIRLIIGGIGIFLVVASAFITQITTGRMHREKTIAFSNPNGEVTVSLAAIEDFLKRLSYSISEIRDLRSDVIAGKNGIEINARVSLWADVNIPETTESIQTIIKNRIQEMLGIEEAIIVRVHVGKIVQKEKKRPKKKGKEEPEDAAPFRGSIEYGKE